jgi:SAM-dependent MidA family methyltransferase
MGIYKRAKLLSDNHKEMEASLKRLVDPTEMGNIYKVLEFSRK